MSSIPSNIFFVFFCTILLIWYESIVNYPPKFGAMTNKDRIHVNTTKHKWNPAHRHFGSHMLTPDLECAGAAVWCSCLETTQASRAQLWTWTIGLKSWLCRRNTGFISRAGNAKRPSNHWLNHWQHRQWGHLMNKWAQPFKGWRNGWRWFWENSVLSHISGTAR